MINFHNYGFLDCKKLKARLEDSNAFLSYYNPTWLFLWSDVYHPEISFGNEFIFIRITIPNLGKVYYPPIPVGGGDLAMTVVELELEAQEMGINFMLGPVLDIDKRKYKNLGIPLYQNKSLSNYIYFANDLTFTITRYKKQRKIAEVFKKKHKNLFYKLMKKDDFSNVLEFISQYREERGIDNTDISFYAKLNMIKKCFEHLYELDLLGMMMMTEEKIYGFVIASIIDNCTYIHVRMSLKEFGASAELLSAFAKYAQAKARYIAIDCTTDQKEEEQLESLFPQRIEYFNGSFNI